MQPLIDLGAAPKRFGGAKPTARPERGRPAALPQKGAGRTPALPQLPLFWRNGGTKPPLSELAHSGGTKPPCQCEEGLATKSFLQNEFAKG